ncbi:hypothetical protein MPH_10510 [Macrophomina phaseolina MS6]|uniref:Uncharacterized protein n=1 Tax=Macrophomina phaseolina (strain MS6) TaxID=1126212 RepID=K2RCX1_MACPH|nr:hypothetical protein MPH_10510 [Macrophomina phaseolina MS6]
MLARTRDGKRAVQALKKDEDIDAEGGNDGGETAIVEEEEKKPLGEGKNVDEGPAVQSPEAEPMVQGEQSSEKAPVSNSQLMPQSTLQSVEKKKRDATAKETYPQSAFIEGTDAPHEDSQGHNKAAVEINIPLTASLIRRMSAEDIFADDTHRNKKYGDLVKEPKTDSTKETLNEQEELDKFLAGLDAVITSGKPGKVQIERETDNSALEGQKKQKSTEEEETKQEERGRTEKEEETEDEKKNVKENRKPKRKKVHKRDPKKDYPDGKGPTLMTDIVPTPRDVRRAQKSTKPPPWEYMPEGPERIKAIRQWKRDQEWDQRMERLEALNKRAAEAEASPKFSRHWLRAQGGGHIMMRKLELAARIGKHNSKRDVLKWDPPGMSEDEEVSDDELRKSWIKFIRSQPSPEDPEPGVLDKHRKKHIEKDVKAGLKRAMGRADYNEWALLNFIWGKRERRWKREAGLKLEEKTNWMTGLVPQKIWIPWHRRLRRWQKRRPTLRKWEPPEDVHERT